jgi:1,5-anhydro-D-fructose reductase (1,5-anhydro-D-mannitol-forming)
MGFLRSTTKTARTFTDVTHRRYDPHVCRTEKTGNIPMTFNVGVVGLGAMGQKMLSDMAIHSAFNVTSAWDPNPESCAAVAIAHPSILMADNADALIADLSIDVLYIASPPNSHRAYFLAALERNLPVYCEKPFGVDLAESEDLVARIEAAQLINIINFNHGNARGSTHIEDQLTLGEMGQVVGADIIIHLSEWPREFQKEATWLAHREQGGFTREMVSHWLYLTRRLLGEGTITRANVSYPDDASLAETHLTAELDFGGVPAFIRGATGGVGPVGTEYTLWGTKKSFRLQSGGRITESNGGPWQELFTDIPNISDQDRQRTLDGVAARLNGEANKMPTTADGFAVQQLVEGLLGSR